MANPFYVDPTGGINTGEQIGRLGQSLAGLGSVLEQRRQAEQDEASIAMAQSEIQQAFQSGDPSQIASTMLQYPEMASQLQSAMAFKSDATRENLVSSSRDIVLNPEMAGEILSSRIETIVGEGGDPTETILALKEYQDNPESFIQSAKNVFATYDPKGFQAYQSAQPKTVEGMTEYQSAMIDAKKVDQELRRLELEDKKLQRQLDRETDEIKKEQLEQKLEANKAELAVAEAEKEKSKQDAVNFSVELYTLADEIANDPQLDSVTGTISTWIPTVSGASQDLLNKAERLESMLTKENLGLMTGVLTDKDIQMLRSISSGLNVTEKGIKGSYEGTRKRLEQISNKVKSAMEAGGSMPTEQVTTNAPQAAIDYLRNNPQFSEQFKQKYGYLPEGM